MKRKIVPLVIIVCISVGFIKVCYADEISELKEQLKAMQNEMQEQAKQIETMQKKIEQLEAATTEVAEKKPANAAEKKPLFVKSGLGELKLSGYLQGQYRWYQLDSSGDTFSIPKARITLDGTSNIPDLGFRIQFDAAASSSILRDAYIQWTKYPWAKLIVGQTFIPFSEDQLTPTPDLDFIDFTRVSSTLSYDRDIGVQVRGELFEKKLSYGAGIFNGAGKNTSDNNDNKDFVARLVVSPFKDQDSALKGLSLGSAFQFGKQPRSGNSEGDRTIWGALAKYEYKKFKLQSEYIFKRQEQIPGLSDKDADGWYILSTYYLLPKLQGAIRFEQYDPDIDVSRDREDIFTLGLNYFFTDYLKLQANYIFKDEQTDVGNNEFALQLQLKY